MTDGAHWQSHFFFRFLLPFVLFLSFACRPIDNRRVRTLFFLLFAACVVDWIYEKSAAILFCFVLSFLFGRRFVARDLFPPLDSRSLHHWSSFSSWRMRFRGDRNEALTNETPLLFSSSVCVHFSYRVTSSAVFFLFFFHQQVMSHDLFELLEKLQASRLDDQRCVLPAYFSQVRVVLYSVDLDWKFFVERHLWGVRKRDSV